MVLSLASAVLNKAKESLRAVSVELVFINSILVLNDGIKQYVGVIRVSSYFRVYW